MKIDTNAAQVAQAYAERAARWDGALQRAMRRALVAVEGAAVDRLSGSGAPGSYPIPVRTGFLRRALGSRIVSPSEGLVFNTANYAWALHTGDIAVGHRGAGRKKVEPRPFLQDAVNDVLPADMVFRDMEAAL